jgi:hypothetical protein
MVYGMARNGIVNVEYLTENNGEGLFHFAKVAPFLEQIRADGMPTAFRNAEWASTASDAGRRMFDYFQEIIKKRNQS